MVHHEEVLHLGCFFLFQKYYKVEIQFLNLIIFS